MENTSLKAGDLFVATSKNQELGWRNAILLVIAIDEANNLITITILNKPIKGIRITRFYPQLTCENMVYYGGPHELDYRVYGIHTYPEAGRGMIQDELYWGYDLDILQELNRGKPIMETNFRFFLGMLYWTFDNYRYNILEHQLYHHIGSRPVKELFLFTEDSVSALLDLPSIGNPV